MHGETIQNVLNETEKNIAKFQAGSSVVVGEERDTVEFVDVITSIDNYIPDEEDAPEEFISKVNVILTVITTIGMIVSVLILAILGIKYMLGSVEEKAEYKKDMIPYIVGAFLLFGITTILTIVQQIGESFNNI